jgi:hypothetical protein
LIQTKFWLPLEKEPGIFPQISPRNFVLIDQQLERRRFFLILGKIWERMANLANMFAALDLDDEGDGEEVEQLTSSKPAAAAAARKIGKSAPFLLFPPRMNWESVSLGCHAPVSPLYEIYSNNCEVRQLFYLC